MARLAVQAMQQLADDVGIPRRMRDVGVPERSHRPHGRSCHPDRAVARQQRPQDDCRRHPRHLPQGLVATHLDVSREPAHQAGSLFIGRFAMPLKDIRSQAIRRTHGRSGRTPAIVRTRPQVHRRHLCLLNRPSAGSTTSTKGMFPSRRAWTWPPPWATMGWPAWKHTTPMR